METETIERGVELIVLRSDIAAKERQLAVIRDEIIRLAKLLAASEDELNALTARKLEIE